MKKLFLSFLILSILLLTLIPSGFLFGQEGITLIMKEVIYDDFPEIDIYFSVYDQSGLPVEDLKQTDFELKEDDTIINDYELESIINTDTPSYIALLLDTSGSMKGDPLDEAKIAAIDFIKSLKDIDEVKIFVFNDDVKYIQDFTTEKNSLINAINSVETEGTKTVLNLAVFKAAKDLDEKPLGNRAIVLLTDGKDEGASIAIEDAIGKATDSKIPIYSVGFGKNFDEDDKNNYDEEANEALSRFSILTSGQFFIAQEEKDLASSFNKISDLLKYQYHLKHTSSLPKDGNDYEIKISIITFDEVIKEGIIISTPTFEVEVNIDQIEDEYEIEQLITITPNISVIPDRFLVDNEINKVEYYLDNDTSLIKEIKVPPYSLDFDPEGLDYGKHSIIVKVYDSIGRVHEITKPIVIPTPPDYTMLYYYIGGGVLAAIIIAVVIVLILKRRRKRMDIKDPSIEADETEEGDLMIDDLDKTWAEGEEAFKGEEGQADGSKTIIKKAEEFIPNAWLTVIKGSHEGEDYSIPPEDDPEKRKITIGRSTNHDIVIDDESSSRDHAYIIIEKDNYKIGDMGSTNGTFLNEKKVSTPRILKDGDRVDIGDTELVFKALTFKKEKKTKSKKKAKKPKKAN